MKITMQYYKRFEAQLVKVIGKLEVYQISNLHIQIRRIKIKKNL